MIIRSVFIKPFVKLYSAKIYLSAATR